jgi:hypothetical protein
MTLSAYNGVTMPAFMYGTAWKKEATTQLVIEAITAGFSAIDTANQLIHYDEARVGEALVSLAQGGHTNSLRRPSADYDASPPIVRKFAHPFTHGLPRFLCPPRAVLSKRIRAGRLGGVVGH